MFNQKFSIETACSNGAKNVFNYYMFFFISILVGILGCALYLVVMGVLDIAIFRYHFVPLTKMFAHSFNSVTGSVHYAGASIQEIVRAYLPIDVANQTIGSDFISVDMSRYDLTYLLSWLLPIALIHKLILEMLSIGWTKVALDVNTSKKISLRYMYEFYYLVPRVFVVTILVGIITLICTALFIIPGVLVFQRLRFARYFIIDKNLSILKSLQASWALTEGSVLHLIGFSLLLLIIGSISYILILGLLFVLPFKNQAEAQVYRQLIK